MDYHYNYLNENLKNCINKDLSNIILSYYGQHMNYTQYLEYKNQQLKKYINIYNLSDTILSYYNTNLIPKNIEIWNNIIQELNIDWFDLESRLIDNSNKKLGFLEFFWINSCTNRKFFI